MYQLVNRFDFRDAFQSSDTYKNNFSLRAIDALFDYFESFENNSDIGIELDIIAICCDYAEYDNLIAACDDYGIVTTTDKRTMLDSLEQKTFVLPIDGTERIIVQNF